jgi:hypothetical protein
VPCAAAVDSTKAVLRGGLFWVFEIALLVLVYQVLQASWPTHRRQLVPSGSPQGTSSKIQKCPHLLVSHFANCGHNFSRLARFCWKNAKCKISAKPTVFLICYLTVGARTTCGHFASVVSFVDEARRMAAALVKPVKQKPAIFAQSVG